VRHVPSHRNDRLARVIVPLVIPYYFTRDMVSLVVAYISYLRPLLFDLNITRDMVSLVALYDFARVTMSLVATE